MVVPLELVGVFLNKCIGQGFAPSLCENGGVVSEQRHSGSWVGGEVVEEDIEENGGQDAALRHACWDGLGCGDGVLDSDRK